MGYDIELSGHDETFRFTFNHSKLLMEHDVYPPDFNGKRVEDIIPYFQRAIASLKKKSDMVIVEKRNDRDFMRQLGELMWKRVPTAVCICCMDALEVLEAAPSDAIWHSDQ